MRKNIYSSISNTRVWHEMIYFDCFVIVQVNASNAFSGEWGAHLIDYLWKLSVRHHDKLISIEWFSDKGQSCIHIHIKRQNQWFEIWFLCLIICAILIKTHYMTTNQLVFELKFGLRAIYFKSRSQNKI